jgi:hypothetical protein
MHALNSRPLLRRAATVAITAVATTLLLPASPAAAASWHAWTPTIQTTYYGVAPAISARPNNRADLFVVTTGYTIRQYYHVSGTTWNTGTNLGSPDAGVVVSIASTTAPNGTIWIFAVGDDGIVQYKNWTSSGGWSPVWWTVGSTPSGFVYNVSAAARDDGQIDIVGRGSDDNIYQRTRATNGAWSAWTGRGRPSVGAGNPAVAAGAGVDIVVPGDDGNVYRRYWRPASGWTGWISEGRAPGSRDVLSVATSWRQDGLSFDMWAQDSFGQIYRRPWTTATGMKDWQNHGWPVEADDWTSVAMTWRPDGRLDAVVQDTSNGSVYWRYWA